MAAIAHDPTGRHQRRRFRGAALILAVLIVAVACGETSSDDEDAAIARGEQLYEANCVACHGGATGGDIADIPPPHNAQGHTWHHPDCLLVELTLEGMPPRPGSPGMPPFEGRLDEDDVHDILSYIRTWWEPDQREFQAEITEQQCS